MSTRFHHPGDERQSSAVARHAHSRWQARIEPFRAKAGRVRRPYPLSAMRRVHCVQLFHGLSDPAIGGRLYEAESVRRFAGQRLRGPLPDEASPAAT